MDVAVNSPRSASETQHIPFDGVHLNNESTSQRRHIRYASPDTSTQRRMNEPALNNSMRSSPNGINNYPAMNRTSPSISPFVISQVLQEPESRDSFVLHETNGQNHDRMETDMNSEDSMSEPQSHEEVEETVGPPAEAVQLEDGELMDTSPDSPNASDYHLPLDPGQAMETTTLSESPLLQDEYLVPASSDNSINTVENSQVIPAAPTPGIESLSSNSSAPLALETETHSASTPVIPDIGTPANGELSATILGDQQPPIITDRNTEWVPPQSTGEWGGEREDESQDDDSTDEEDYPVWANLKEDTSTPDEEELKAIEEKDEVSALDHEHWEKITYEALDDPEYVPGELGRITWQVQGVNGTPENPNKEKIMRSPSVLVGDHYWNIKYYPRGNDGTEWLSVYIECSTSPHEEQKSVNITNMSSGTKSNDKHLPSAALVDTSIPLSNETPALADPPVNASQDLSGEDFSSSQNLPAAKKSVAPACWEVAAQVGCIIYNPAEPRVHSFQKSSHRYYNENPDWGWTRFHGPWDEIHKRQRGHRQALLRNDTLVFTAYIRTVKDETGNLWWHPPKGKPEWNSLDRVGLRRLVCRNFQSSALIAALSSWIYLSPITDLVLMQIPDQNRVSENPTMPLLDEFRNLIRETLGTTTLPTDPPESTLEHMAKILEWYGENISSKLDVVATWETLQRIFILEISEIIDVPDAGDLFRDVVTLKQSDIRKDEQPLNRKPEAQGSAYFEPRSVEETVELALQMRPNVFLQEQDLTAHQQPVKQYPSVLQIELHRQKFFSDVRRWKKLTHKIRIDETLAIDLPFSNDSLQYTLYGMIVHNGDLESQDYYSVVRPGGRGSPWVKYAGDKDRKGVTRLTSKQAITNHEGQGTNSEGIAAVAYVVLYVRTDSLSKILGCEPKLEQSPGKSCKDVSSILNEAPASAPDSTEVERTILVRIFQSDRFRGYNGRGILDPRFLHSLPNLKLEFAASMTLAQVEKYLVEQKTNADKNCAFRLWALNPGRHIAVRGSPQLTSSFQGDYRLDELEKSFGACKFWLHCLSADEAVEFRQQENTPLEEPTAVLTSGQSAPTEEAIPEQDSRTSQHTESLVPPPSDNLTDPASQTNGTSDDEDTVMHEVQDDSTGEDLVPPAPALMEPSLSWISGTRKRPTHHQERIYVFLKIFDCQNQVLYGVGSYFAKRDEKIGVVMRRLLSLAPDEKFDVFWEKSLLMKENHRLDSNLIFSDISHFQDGCILIVQRRSSESETAKLEAEGKCTSIIDFFAWLHNKGDPSYLPDYRLQSYFGSSYTSAEQKYGRPHGHGVQISMPGDAYSGNFVAGTMSGLGTMDFANGDTYTGQWKGNEPNGQGKMVYAKTGNVYIGGFRKRKRHGKGTMQFEVADEEMQLCRICYEEEMDALFYDCGHVAACEACAKQVDTCPVCRKGVRAVVKIWRT